jgi:small subunit ribosomal protein S5
MLIDSKCKPLTISGFGLRVQHNIFEMARAAGIEDLAGRVPRGRNNMNVAKATYQALMSQKLPDQIARGRGKKLVDVRKVYYGGTQELPQSPAWKEES